MPKVSGKFVKDPAKLSGRLLPLFRGNGRNLLLSPRGYNVVMQCPMNDYVDLGRLNHSTYFELGVRALLVQGLPLPLC